jgi:outer membrane protein assembly factor BamB
MLKRRNAQTLQGQNVPEAGNAPSVYNTGAAGFSVPSRRRSRSVRSLGRSILWLSCGLFIRVSTAAAWQQFPEPQGTEARAPRSDRDGLVPVSDRDAESWLKRGRDAAAQEDWKLAADTLSRVIEQFGDKTVSLDDGRHFFSAARCAQDQIRQWPEEGLAMYRLLYDPEVRQRLDAAQKAGDLDALRNIARKHPHSTYGPEAINLLAAWLIDRREPGEAVELLTRLLELPHSRIPKWQTQAKLAVAYALSGDVAAASGVLKQLRADQTAHGQDARARGSEGQRQRDGATSPADFEKRIDAISRFIEAARSQPATTQTVLPLGPTQSAGRVGSWPILLGPPSAEGQMPAVDPAIAPDTALCDTLPGGDQVSANHVLRLIKRTGRPPVWQMVTDGRMLFVTCPEGLMARDLASFDFAWKGVSKRLPRDRVVESQRLRMGLIETDNSDRLDENSTRALFHEYRGAVSTAMEMVFVIEQAGTPREQYPSKEGVPPKNDIFYGDDFAEPNSLRAYEAETGRAVWTKGRGGPIEDGLRLAHFFAAPLPVSASPEAVLAAPFQLGADFQLAVIARDGKLVKTILLGTGQPGMFPMNGILPPTVYEGTIYVSTGAGMLVALSAHDFSLRWQTPYERSPMTMTRMAPTHQFGPAGPATGGLGQADEWLAGPPLVVGSLVILAAPDSVSLLAFERQTGRLRWSFPRGEHRYLIGSDGQRVFVAGKTILALDAGTGQSIWAMYPGASSITGRPALCGNEIFVPTDDGLVRLRAATGAGANPAKLSGGEEALGNLLAFDGALYSLTADGICKFPDIERSRIIAEEALAKNPADRRSLLRLAQLAALRKDWSAALGLLDQADAGGAGGGSSAADEGDLVDRIHHQRVSALIQLAGQATAMERAGLLQRAVSAAKRPDDALEAGLAMCELQSEGGGEGCADAFLRGLDLLSRFGYQPIAVEEGLAAAASVVLGHRLGALWGTMNAEQRRTAAASFEGIIASGLTGLAASGGIETADSLIRLADALGFAPQGAKLDVELGAWHTKHSDPETAGYFFRRALERCRALPNAPADVAREARVRLAAVLAAPGEGVPLTGATEAARLVSELEGQPADATVPAGLPAIDRSQPPRRLNEALKQLRARLPADAFQTTARLPGVLRGSPSLDLIADDVVSAQFALDARSFDDPGSPLDPFSEVVPIRVLRQIKGVAATGSQATNLQWTNSLNIALDDDPPPDARKIDLVVHAAALAGTVAVLDAGSQICAVGLASGRVLWPPVAVDRTQGPLPEPAVIQLNATVIMAVDATTLLAAPARADAKPIWRRRLPWRRIGSLGQAEENLVAVDGDASQLALIDPATGRIRRQYALDGRTASAPATEDAEEDAPPDRLPSLALVGKVVCTARAGGLTARDVLTGQPLWSRPPEAAVQDVRDLDGRHAAVFYPNNRLEVVRADSGAIVQQVTTTGLVLPPVDITLDWTPTGGRATGRLLLFTKTDSDAPKFVLQSIPLDRAGEPWQRDLGRLASVNRRMLRASPLYVAAVQYVPKSDEDRSRRGDGGPGALIDRTLLSVYDKATGRRLLESPYEFDFQRLPRPDGPTKLIKDVIVLDQRIIAVAPEGYYVLGRSGTPHETPMEQGAAHEP